LKIKIFQPITLRCEHILARAFAEEKKKKLPPPPTNFNPFPIHIRGRGGGRFGAAKSHSLPYFLFVPSMFKKSFYNEAKIRKEISKNLKNNMV